MKNTDSTTPLSFATSMDRSIWLASATVEADIAPAPANRAAKLSAARVVVSHRADETLADADNDDHMARARFSRAQTKATREIDYR